MKKKAMHFMILALVMLTGCVFNSGIRIGYVGSTGRENWSGRYKKFDGCMRHNMNIEEGPLYIEVQTESGEITVGVYEKDGDLIFETKEAGIYTVEAEGRIKIRIDGDDHRGSFDIGVK